MLENITKVIGQKLFQEIL